MRQSEQISELVKALAKAQAVVAPPSKNKKNSHFGNDYADLASVIASVREPLSANGIAYTFVTDVEEGKAVLDTRLIHTSGQWIGSTMHLSAAGTPQQRGSELTYLKRYSLCGLIGIAAEDEDDDGNSASGNTSPRQQPQRQAAPAKQTAARPAPAATPVAGSEWSVDEVKRAQVKLDEAWVSRGIDVEVADGEMSRMLAELPAPNLKAAGRAWCKALIADITAGKYDDLKGGVAAEKETANV